MNRKIIAGLFAAWSVATVLACYGTYTDPCSTGSTTTYTCPPNRPDMIKSYTVSDGPNIATCEEDGDAGGCTNVGDPESCSYDVTTTFCDNTVYGPTTVDAGTLTPQNADYEYPCDS